MNNPIKIYIDKKYHNKNYNIIPWLQPWGNEFESIEDNVHGLDDYLLHYQKYFKRTSLEECDYVVASYYWNETQDNTQIIKLAKLAKIHNKKIIIYFHSDSSVKIPIENSIILRTTVNSYDILDNEYVFPPYIENFAIEEANNEINCSDIYKKSKYPVVSFCGSASYHREEPRIFRWFRSMGHKLISRPYIDRKLKSLGLYLTSHPGKEIRLQGLYLLKKSPLIKTNFILRDFFYNNVYSSKLTPEEGLQIQRKSRLEFVKNVVDGDYVFTPRGSGNFSFRFYETLALYRIPVFINSHSVFPFSDLIDWKKYCIIVDQTEMSKLPEIVYQFHQDHTQEELHQMRINCRRLWEEYFSPLGYVNKMHPILLSRLTRDNS